MIHMYLIVELRTPAMPFGLGAFEAVKLRSLSWQHRFGTVGPRAAEIGRKCDQVPGEGQSAAGSAKEEDRKQTCVCTLPVLSQDVYG